MLLQHNRNYIQTEIISICTLQQYKLYLLATLIIWNIKVKCPSTNLFITKKSYKLKLQHFHSSSGKKHWEMNFHFFQSSIFTWQGKSRSTNLRFKRNKNPTNPFNVHLRDQQQGLYYNRYNVNSAIASPETLWKHSFIPHHQIKHISDPGTILMNTLLWH